jgi:mannose-6-phosphate isomerase-like protein (cupin superfamily)
VTAHAALPSYENHGNTLRGIATATSGARNYEVWRTSVAVGSATPPHSHQSEEVFIFLQGKGKARIGDQEYTFEAPATVVAPANVPHQFFNIGNVPTDAIVVVGVGSKIWDSAGNEMHLPWRK